MAKARKNLLIGFNFPLKGWDTGWARQQQKPLTTPDAMNVLPFDLDRRNRGAKRPGFSVLTGGAIGSVALTYREAHRCDTDVFAGLFVSTTEISAYPYTFSYAGGCYYILEIDPTTTTPTGTMPPAGSRTAYDDCTACAGAVSPPPPPATYRRVRRCTDNTLSTLYIATADVGSYPTVFLRAADDNCYYVTDADATTTTPGTLVGTKADKSDCTTCAADRGGGGDATYYQGYDCDGNPQDAWILASDIDPDGPIFAFRNDFLDAPLEFGAHDSTNSPGRIYDRATETTPATSCNVIAGCYEEALPDTATLTFTGVTMQASCTGTTDGSESWKSTGSFNLTVSATKISESSTRAVYEGSFSGQTLSIYYCSTPGGANLACSLVDIPGVCYGASVQNTGFCTLRLEVDVSLGTPTGFQVTIDFGNPSQGPRAFRGSTNVVNCRGAKTIPNDITSRSISNHTSVATSESFASGGHVVVSLDF